VPLVVFAGKEYGTGSSRDWAAKGTKLLGVRAVIAESFERIHRSNLVGMGVLPLIADGKVTVKVAAADGEHRSGEVWLCPITDKAPVAIGRGENSGHTLTYTNVVRRWVKLGDWDGKAASFSLPLASLPDPDYSLKDVDHIAVIVQSGVAAKPGLMLGAATASLR
jgi:hypothetical protein